MAAPVDSARQGTNISTAGTSHAINVGSPVAGTLLIVFVRFAAAPGTVTFTGYTLIAGPDTSDATDDETRIYARVADGAEGATDTLTTGNSVKLAAMAYEITGADSTIANIHVSTVAVGTTTANTANPTSVAPVSAPEDTLYLALAAGDGESAYTAVPTNYANLGTANSGTGGAVATNCFLGTGSRALTASSSEDPGAFTHAAHSNGWTAYALAIVGPQPVTETPTPGGGIAAGTAPAPNISETIAGAVASGTAPAPGASATIQGAIAGGAAATATSVAVSPGGAVANGTPPSFAGTVDTITIGGATAGGTAPVARTATTIAGAAAAGTSPSSSSTLASSGAAAAGTSPGASSTSAIGGATAGGFDSVAASQLGQGGAAADGTTPTSRASLTAGGANAGGTAPAEDIGGAGMSETPTPGGALAGGFAPTARTSSTTGGALAAGIGGTSTVSVTSGGATAGGTAPSLPGMDFVDPGGATAGGFSPGASSSSSTGGASTGGFSAGALVLVSPGGAIADGFTILIAQGVYDDPDTGRISPTFAGSIADSGEGRIVPPTTGRTV
jgi:hypothetical protein